MVSSVTNKLPFRRVGDVTLSFLILVQCVLFVVETSLENGALVSKNYTDYQCLVGVNENEFVDLYERQLLNSDF